LARFETKIKDNAPQFLEKGEELRAVIVARPRGWTQSNASAGGGFGAGLVGGTIGGKKQQKNIGSAEEAGFELPNPMALGVTNRRLVAFEISSPIGLGIGGNVKGLKSAVPLSQVDEIEVKRLAAGKTVTVTINGSSFKLEAGAGANAKGLAEALEQARAAA
jgi:hypothetical protein